MLPPLSLDQLLNISNRIFDFFGIKFHIPNVIVLTLHCVYLEIVMYIDKDKSNAAAAAATETLDSRTSRPGPVGLSFEIIDAQIVRDDDDKYVVGDLKFC